MRAGIASFLAGTIFALGLGVSGMTNPNKVLGFLDLAGVWDPSLLLVMGGAAGVPLFLFRVILRRPNPLFAEAWHVPTRRDLDRNLVAGALIFGVGWGLAGFCPGPAITALAFGRSEVTLFVAAMVTGGILYRLFHERKHQ